MAEISYGDERERAAPPQRRRPGGLGGFARRSVGFVGLRLANDDLRAVEREVVELQIEALAVAMRPNGPDRPPVALLAVLGHGVNTVARRVGRCLAHVMSFRFEVEAMH